MELNMEYITNFIYWIKRNSRIMLLWILLFLTLILFENKISSLISNYSVIGENEVNGRYFILIHKIINAGIYGIFIWFLFKNYRLSKQFNFWTFLLSSFYLFLKSNNSDELIFLNYINKSGHIVLYSDIFLIIGRLTL